MILGLGSCCRGVPGIGLRQATVTPAVLDNCYFTYGELW